MMGRRSTAPAGWRGRVGEVSNLAKGILRWGLRTVPLSLPLPEHEKGVGSFTSKKIKLGTSQGVVVLPGSLEAPPIEQSKGKIEMTLLSARIFAVAEGIWKCRHCSWTYQLLGSGIEPFQKHQTSCQVVMESKTITHTRDDGFNKPMIIVEPSSSKRISQKDQVSGVSAPSTTVIIPQGDVQIYVKNRSLVETRRGNEWEVLKSIVYGGLIESIISLGVVSSAAGANTSTLNVVSLGLANLIGGFLVMLHDLSEIRITESTNQNEDQSDLYWKLLGRRASFRLHVTVSLISYTLFGLLPPLIYGFSARESSEKLIMVAAASLLCISVLSVGKAHISEPKSYIKSFIYYLGLGLTVSGLSYVAGVMISRFLEQIGLFMPQAPSPSSVEFFGVDLSLISQA